MPQTGTDELDRRIVAALVRDGRASHRSIASELGVAASTVSNRLGDLEASGAIEGYGPLLDYAAFGYPIRAIVHLRTDDAVDEDQPPLSRDARAQSGPPLTAGLWSTVHRVTGSFDYVTIGHFPNRRVVAEAVVELRSAQGVVATKTEFVVDTLRDHTPIPTG